MKRILLLILTALFSLPSQAEIWTIAIDPGHGGKDPGAVGRNLGIYEKNVTLSIARELKALLDKDPNFRGVLTRNGDYYISVPDRSGIARRHNASYLISIHADSSESSSLRGASVWVLSNRRANDEMGQWLEADEKRSELLGGAGEVLSNSKEVYLNQTVLDLQFGHSQRVGYELGNAILNNFAKITTLSRSRPQHASLGVLRSPDIPSVLVETGFLSNPEEEAKLNTLTYRKRIAYMIYQGLLDYRKRNGNLNTPTNRVEKLDKTTTISEPQKADSSQNKTVTNEPANAELKSSGIVHIVKSGERLDKIAQQYKVKADDIVSLNKLKKRELFIGQKLAIPDNSSSNNKSAVKNNDTSATATNEQNNAELKASGIIHEVKSGERLDKIAKQYNVKVDDIVSLNKLKKQELFIGQKLAIPDNSTSNNKSAVKNNDKSEKTPNEQNNAELKASGTIHEVKSGERLDKIAKQYNVKVDDIVSLNKLKKRELFIGQKLAIPDNGTSNNKSAVKNNDKSATATNEQNNIELKASGTIHEVKSGERLDKIAKQYNVKVNDIVSLNKLKKRELFIGQKLAIPDNGSSSNSTSKDKSAVQNQEKSQKSSSSVKEKADTKTEKTTSKTTNKETASKYHIVEKNQTLYSISRLHNVPVEKLNKLNPQLKDGKVKVGQKIQIKE